MASAIAVVGSDIYIAGYEFNRLGISVAKYWKTGRLYHSQMAQERPCIFHCCCRQRCLCGGGGRQGSQILEKRQATCFQMAQQSGCIFHCRCGKDVYVAGWNPRLYGVAKYWKNGQAVALTDGTRICCNPS